MAARLRTLRSLRRRGARLLVLAATLAGATACGEGEPLDFRYHPPAGWRVLEGGETGSPFAVAAGPARGDVAPTITVERGTARGELSSFVDAALADLSAHAPGFRLLERGLGTHTDGRPAARLRFVLTDEGRDLRMLQLVLLRDGTSFVVTCSRADGEDPTTDAAFEGALATFVTH